MRLPTVVVTTMVLLAGIAGPAMAASQQGSAYAGAHVEFEMQSSAVVDYRVDGETLFERVEVQSKEQAESSGLVSADASLSAVTDIEGSALTMESSASAEAMVKISAESGATIRAHDNEHGIFVVAAGGQSQYVTANVSDGATAEQSGERVVVTTESGAKGTFLVVGDGTVTVNENGDVTAELGKHAKLVYRTYPQGERDEGEKQQEQWIQNGTAVAEVYVFEKGGEYVADTVQYSSTTTVEVTQKTKGEIAFTVDRAKEQGKIVITSVSEKLLSNAEQLQVTVSGSAATEVSSYSKVAGAIGGDTARYMVTATSETDASADVVVGITHFSEKQVTMRSSESGTTDDGSGDDSGDGSDGSDGSNGGDGSSTTSPGFGVGVALVALLGTALVAARRR